MIRLHDLCHTHASLPLADGEPVKTVSERLEHASATVPIVRVGQIQLGDAVHQRRDLLLTRRLLPTSRRLGLLSYTFSARTSSMTIRQRFTGHPGLS